MCYQPILTLSRYKIAESKLLADEKGPNNWNRYLSGFNIYTYTLIDMLCQTERTTLNTFIKFDWLVNSVECKHVSNTNCNLQNGYFVYHPWGCTSTYRPLSYPFISLTSNIVVTAQNLRNIGDR